jgi:hypothetical protein
MYWEYIIISIFCLCFTLIGMNIYYMLTCVFETNIVLNHIMFDILGFVLRIWLPFIPAPTTHPVSRDAGSQYGGQRNPQPDCHNSALWTDTHTQGNQPAVTSCNWKHVNHDLNATSDIKSASPLLTNELGKDECRRSQDHASPRAAIKHKRAAVATAQGVTDNQLVPYKKLRNAVNWNVLYNWPRSVWAVEGLDIRSQRTGNTWSSGQNICTTCGRQWELLYHILKERLLFFYVH